MASILDFSITLCLMMNNNVCFGLHVKKDTKWAISNHNLNKSFNLHFVSCSYKGEFHRHFEFVHLNLLFSNVYFWSVKLL